MLCSMRGSCSPSQLWLGTETSTAKTYVSQHCTCLGGLTVNSPHRPSDAVTHAAFCRDSQELPSQNEAEIHPSFVKCCINKPKELQVTSLHSDAWSSGFTDYTGCLLC